MTNIKIFKKLLFLGLFLGVLGQNKPVLSADVENKAEIELEQSQLIGIESDEEILAKNLYLPSDCSVSSLDKISEFKAKKILTYLTTFNDLATKRSPFTIEEQQIFDNVMNVEKDTEWWLKYGQAAILTSALSPMIGLAAYSNDITSQQAIVIISVATTFAGLINAWLAFYATGTLPDKASQKANDRQNKFVELRDTYIRLSKNWLNLYFSNDQDKREFAISIANKMKTSFDNLIFKVKEKVGYAHADNMLSPIKEVMYYILNPQDEKLEICPLICTYIDYKEGYKRLEQVD